MYSARCIIASLPFLILIIVGYIGGITAKVMTGNVNYVFIVYLINLAIVLLNLAVYIRNTVLDKKNETATKTNAAFAHA